MKKISNLRWLIMSLLLAIGASNAWGDSVEITQSALGLTGSYTSNTEKTINGITYVYTDLMKNNTDIQAKASTGVIYNKTAYPGDITSVSITHSGTARATTIHGSSDGTNWTQVATGNGSITADFSSKGYKYFKITRGSNAAYWTKIVVEYDGGSTLENSDLAITNAPVALSFDLYNNSAAQTVSFTTSSTGAVTVSGGSSYVATSISDNTITVTPTAVTPSTQTITINQAADGSYKAGSATFTVDVTDSTPFAGGNITFVAGTDLGTSSSNNSPDAVTKSVVTISCTDAAFATAQYRFYQSSDAIFTTSQGKITKIEFVNDSSYPLSRFSLNSGSSGTWNSSTGTWTGNASSVSFHASGQVRSTQIIVTISIDSSKEDPTFAWSAATATATVGETPTLPTLTNNSDGTVTYSSSDTDVATIANDGTVTIIAAGTTTITANVTATTTFNAATASYELTVSEPAPVNQLVTVDSDGNVTFLFNDTGWGLPEGSANKLITATQYTNSGYTITVAGAGTGNGFYYNTDGYLIMGKTGAYLTLPAFNFDVERIEVVGRSGASSAVTQNIYVGDDAVSTETTSATGTNNYDIAAAYQAAGNVYTLKVTNGYNTQITSIKVYKKSTNPSLSFTTATANVNVSATYTQAVNAYNIGENTITYTSSNAEIATVNNSTGEVTGVSAGTVTITASVTVAGIEYTATYELTVKKNDPVLSFEQTVVSITEGDTYAGQTVTKPSDILDSEITYSSNNPSVAIVDAATGAITVGSALGSATITASFGGNTKYNGATATYTFKVTAASVASGDYEKVTSTADLSDGEYLIVYEDGSLAFDGSLETLDASGNTISVTIDTQSNPYTIESTATVDAAAFTIAAVDGGYSISNAAGFYIGWESSSKNGLTAGSTALVNTIEFDESGNAVITGTGGRVLRYNSASGDNNLRFRYYTSGTQQAIQLYKKSGSTGQSVAAPVITPETGTYETRPQTVTITCSTPGATIYYTTDGTTPTTSSPVYTDSFDVNKNTTVQAIAVITVDEQEMVSRVSSSVISMYVHAPVFSPVDGSQFSEDYQVTISADEGLTIYYIAQDNKIFNTEAGGRTATASEGNGTLVSTALVYSSALTFGQSMMVTAICMDADGNLSDPVTVKYTYTGAVVPPYYSSFSASEGDFTDSQEPDENTITGIGAPEWRMNSNTGADAIARWGEERYYMYVRGTSGNTVQNRTRWYGSAYLTSPIIDLTGKGSASFSFIHAAHHFYADPNTSASTKDANLETTLDDTKIPLACKVQVGICDASGNVSTWTDIPSNDINWCEQLFDPSKTGVSADGKSTTNTSSRSGLFPRANSGDISLSDYEDQKIRIRFAYTSSPSNYGTWNIDQITVNAVDVEEITMNSRGWTTYVFDHDIDAYTTTQNYISGGEETLKIYKVTEFDKETCVLQQLGKFEEYTTSNNSERYIPAKTPVVIQGPAGATIDFVEYSAPEMLPTVKNNLLIASLSPNTAKAPVGSGIRYFVLQWNNSTNQPWFNKVSEGREIPDHRAYLNGVDQMEAVTTQSNPVKGIYILGDEEEEATAIDVIEDLVNTQDNKFYNLAGQRVMNPTKGIYIVNGKKVFIK